MPVAASATIPFAVCPTCLGGGTASTVTALNDLTDVTISAPLTAGMALVYTGTQWVNRNLLMNDLGDADTVTTPPTNGQLLHWDALASNWVPTDPTGGCFTAELGGVGGNLVLGDGAGVPNPVATDFTLQADSVHAILTTPPVGGSTVVELRLMPAATVISTITFTAGNRVGTASPYAALSLADGQWFESVVTSVAPTPGSELTVMGEVCGLNAGTSSTATLPALSYTHTQAVASTTWTVNHNLTFVPTVFVEDAAGNDVTPDNITYTSASTLTITFLAPQSGTARLS